MYVSETKDECPFERGAGGGLGSDRPSGGCGWGSRSEGSKNAMTFQLVKPTAQNLVFFYFCRVVFSTLADVRFFLLWRTDFFYFGGTSPTFLRGRFFLLLGIHFFYFWYFQNERFAWYIPPKVEKVEVFWTSKMGWSESRKSRGLKVEKVEVWTLVGSLGKVEKVGLAK